MEIECFVMHLHELYSEDVYNEAYAIVPQHGYWKQKLEKIEKFCRKEDKVRGLGAIVLVYYLMKKNNLLEESITYNQYGKPFVENCKIQFNVSHSGDYSACSFGMGKSGVDIEQINCYDLGIAEHYFDYEEYQAIVKCGQNMFTRIWTMKESYIKAIGKGLYIPLDTFCVVPGNINKKVCNDKWAFISKTSYIKDKSEFHFVEFATDGYNISVCSKNHIYEEVVMIEIGAILEYLRRN